MFPMSTLQAPVDHKKKTRGEKVFENDRNKEELTLIRTAFEDVLRMSDRGKR